MAIHVQCSMHHRYFIKKFFTLRIKVPHVESQSKGVQGDLSRKFKNKLETQFQFRFRFLQEGQQPLILSLRWSLTSKDCKSRIFILTSSPHFQHFSCWKIRFKTQVSSCSDFPTEAMSWIKEVEMVDSADELKSSRSIKGTHFPNLE